MASSGRDRVTKPIDKTQVLNRAELFAGLPRATLAAIALIAELRSFEKGDVIYSVGDEADDVYVLVSGLVEFTLGGESGPQSLASIVMSSRHVFGWAALVDGQPRRVAAADCLEASTVLAISGRRLMEILETDPSAGFLVMRRLSDMIARNFMDARPRRSERA